MINERYCVKACVFVSFGFGVWACSQNAPTVADQQKCFDDYIAQHIESYPLATLEKTAALKCYQ